MQINFHVSGVRNAHSPESQTAEWLERFFHSFNEIVKARGAHDAWEQFAGFEPFVLRSSATNEVTRISTRISNWLLFAAFIVIFFGLDDKQTNRRRNEETFSRRGGN
jgi:hypothetical protein